MPASRFLALSAAIPAIEAADDLRALNVATSAAHPGDKGQNVRSLSNELVGQAGGRKSQRMSTPIVPGITPGVQELDDGDSIRSELERKRATWLAENAAGRVATA